MTVIQMKIWMLCVLTLWLIPITLSGLNIRIPIHGNLGRWLAFHQDPAALFASRESDWHMVAYEKSSGAENWSDWQRNEVSQMPVAGYRTRMDRLIASVNEKKQVREVIWTRLGVYLQKQLDAKYGRIGERSERARIVMTRWKMEIPAMKTPRGHWEDPPVSALPGGVLIRPIVTYQRRADGYFATIQETGKKWATSLPDSEQSEDAKSKTQPQIKRRATSSINSKTPAGGNPLLQIRPLKLTESKGAR
jgi:hypothetical protein